jgi:RNA polymerase sigma-70 factor (ECF subfamily)
LSLSASNTDTDLFHRIARGDERAFEELFRRWDRRIYPFVLKMIRTPLLAEELTQEIFIKIWQHREKLDEVVNPEAYILTIATRHTLDLIKRQLNESRMLEKFSAIRPRSHNDTDEILLFRDRAALIQQAVDQLPPQQKAVYLLSRQEGLDYDAIGQQMNISPNTVRNHLVKALQSIRTYLHDQDLLPTFLLTCALLLVKK